MKQSSTSKPWKEVRPQILGAANSLTDAYNTNAGNIQKLTDSTLGQVTPWLSQRLEQGDTGVNAARDYGTDVLSGKYLDEGNPYLQQIIDDTNNDVLNQTQAALGVRGLTGGSNYADIISRNIGRNTSNLRYNDYARERGAMDSAAGRAGGIASADYLPIQGLFGALQASQTPIDAASRYAGGLGGLLGGYQSQSQGGLGSLLGPAAQLGSAAFFASERRVKRDIEQIGEMPDGLGVYNYRYLWDADDEPLRTGVMVDEVAALRPWALGPVVDGIQTVDYRALLEMAA